jgi:hypothetical protein
MKIVTTIMIIFLMASSMPMDSAKKKAKKAPRDRFQNRLINYAEFQKIVDESSGERESRRLTEEKFIEMMVDPNVIVLDARSESRYNLRHIKGAKNLPFTEFTEETLTNVIPKKSSKILIYCNNNFEGSPEAFAAKAPAASLNLSTFTSLKAYGYQNIYELGPLLNIKETKIPFVGTELDEQPIENKEK